MTATLLRPLPKLFSPPSFTRSGAILGSHALGIYEPTEEEDDAIDSRLITLGELPGSPRIDPVVIMVFGRRGMGKTAAMTTLTMAQRERMRRNGHPWQLWANYNIYEADYRSPYLVDYVIQFPPEARNLTLAIDEIQTAAAGRRSLSTSNVNLSQFLTQIRKRTIECMFTTQFPQTIDQQVLMQCDLFCQVEWINTSGKLRGARMYWHDWWSLYTDNYHQYERRWFPPHKSQATVVHELWGLEDIFPHYNTKEIVVPMWSKHRDAILGASGWELEDGDEPDAVPAMPDMGDPEMQARGEMTFDANVKKEGGFRMSELLTEAQKLVPHRVASKKDLTDYLAEKGLQVASIGGGKYVVEPVH